MPTLTPVILPAKVLKNGQHKVRISISHNGETRYIPTEILIDSVREFKNGTIVKRPDAAILNTKVRRILNEFQERMDEIEYVNGLTCPELVFLIKNLPKMKNRTLQSIFDEYISISTAKESSLFTYQTLWKALCRHINKEMMVAHISLSVILSLEKALLKSGKSTTTSHNIMALFSTLINYAKRCGYVTYKVDPLLGYRLPQTEIRQCWLSVDEIRRIRDCVITKENTAVCRDIFMLSYYLGGINLVDLAKINFKQCGKHLKYIRQKNERRVKNNKYVEFDIPEEAMCIIQKYMDKNGYINTKYIRIYKNNPGERRSLTYKFKKLKEVTGIENRLIYYSARKSFSQHAFNLGVNTPVIEYILGHSLAKRGTSLYSYISVTPEMATKAIRLVLDNLK